MIHLHPRLTRTHTVLTGRKNAHTSSKSLQIHKVFPAAFSSSGRLSASAKLLAPDSDGFSSDFWLLRRRCVVTHQGEKGKKRRKDTLSGVCALVNRGYIYHNTAAPGLEALLCFFRAKNKKLTFSIEICSAACYTIQACRVGISVLLQLPKLARRVRLPYPAPHRCGLYCPQRFLLPFLPGITSAYFAVIRAGDVVG